MAGSWVASFCDHCHAEVFSTDDGYCSSCGEPLPTEEMLARPCTQCGEVDCMEDTHDG